MLEGTKKDKTNFMISDSAFLKDRGVFNKVIGNHGKCSREKSEYLVNLFVSLFVAEYSFNNSHRRAQPFALGGATPGKWTPNYTSPPPR